MVQIWFRGFRFGSALFEGLNIEDTPLAQHRLAVLAEGASPTVSADDKACCIIVGGEPVGKRYKRWNFVSSDLDRIEQAKQDWKAGKFEPVPQETEFIPLPPAEAQQQESPL